MSNARESGRLALQACRANPDTPSYTLGERLYREHPEVYSTASAAWNRVRYYRGTCGEYNRSRMAGKKPLGRRWVRMILPDPVEQPDPWRIVDLDFRRATVLADLHIPFHDSRAVEAAVRRSKKFRPDTVILLGDVADFYGQSWWDKDPQLRFKTLEHARKVTAFLEWLRSEHPRARIVYLEGNHEERLWRDAWRNCPEFAGMEAFSLAGLVRTEDAGVEVVSGRKILRHHHLHLLHGHEVEGRLDQSVNTARGLFRKAVASALCGHTHTSSSHTEQTFAGKPFSTWSVGCLCDLHPRYRPLNRWQHGMALLHGGEGWSVENLKIIDGRVV